MKNLPWLTALILVLLTPAANGEKRQVDAAPQSPQATSACDAVNDESLRAFCHAQRTGLRKECLNAAEPDWRALCLYHAHPDIYSCDNVAGEHLQSYCYALKSRSPIACFDILDNDLEFLCYGHILKNRGHCDEVKNPELHLLCLGLQESKTPPRRPL